MRYIVVDMCIFFCIIVLGFADDVFIDEEFVSLISE